MDHLCHHLLPPPKMGRSPALGKAGQDSYDWCEQIARPLEQREGQGSLNGGKLELRAEGVGTKEVLALQ